MKMQMPMPMEMQMQMQWLVARARHRQEIPASRLLFKCHVSVCVFAIYTLQTSKNRQCKLPKRPEKKATRNFISPLTQINGDRFHFAFQSVKRQAAPSSYCCPCWPLATWCPSSWQVASGHPTGCCCCQQNNL